MKGPGRILLVAALAGLVVWGWYRFFPGDDTAIRRQLARVARLASFRPNEAALTRLGNAKELSGLLTAEAQVVIDIRGYHDQVLKGRDQVFEAAMAARNTGPGAKIEFLDPVIQFPGSREGAVVDLTMKAQISGEPDLIVQELRFSMKKQSGEWLIDRIETAKSLR